jgi:hypothetical protein
VARAKRKVEELINSVGSAEAAIRRMVPVIAAAANSMARNNKALPKNTGEKRSSCYWLIMQHADEPQEGDPGRNQI